MLPYKILTAFLQRNTPLFFSLKLRPLPLWRWLRTRSGMKPALLTLLNLCIIFLDL